MTEYEYNVLEDEDLLIKREYKEKGKEYGIVKLNKQFIHILTECIDLMSVSPSISVKFAKRIEEFLSSRFQELSAILYEVKSLPEVVGLELSKENYRDILNGLDFASVFSVFKKKNYPVQELKSQLKKVKFLKFK